MRTGGAAGGGQTGVDACDTPALDPALDAAIRDGTVYPASGPISSDLRALRESVGATGVASFSDLECFPNLVELTFDRGEARDLTPIGMLGHLELLALANHPVSDLAPLAGHGALRSLTVQDTLDAPGPLSDLTPLASVPSLEQLTVTGTSVSDLSPLRALSLVGLHIAHTEVASLEPLSTMSTLRTLTISSTAVVDLSPIDFPPAATSPPTCAEIEAIAVPLDAPSVDEVIPRLCALGWTVTWTPPSSPDGSSGGVTCGPGCEQRI